jgi:poly(A)-specific ribonuclease
MQVTKENFGSILPSVLEAIESSDFIAFDLEFTGLGMDKNDRIHVMDTSQERYEKTARICSQFLPLQVGICTFKYNDKEDFYVAKPWNFYAFPHTGPREVAPFMLNNL